MKKIVLLSFVVVYNLFAFSQTTIKMNKENGVYKIPCKINGLKLDFIFDTGASNVVISETEANFMLKNNYLQKDDIIGTSYTQVANGDIIKNKSIIIREIDIKGLKLYNIKAIIVQTNNAPLLLGQSVIEKLGTIQIKSNELTILNKENSYDFQNVTEINDNINNTALNSKLKSIRLKNEKCKTIKELKNLGVEINESEYNRDDNERCCAKREIIQAIIETPNDMKIGKLINLKIEKHILELLGDKKHQTLNDYINSISNEDILYYDEVSVNSIIKTNNKNIFSVELFYWSMGYMSGTSMQEHKYYNFNKNTGEEIKLSDIIKKEKQDEFYNLIKEKSEKEQIYISFENLFQKVGNFIISSEGIEFFDDSKFSNSMFISFDEISSFINYSSTIIKK